MNDWYMVLSMKKKVYRFSAFAVITILVITSCNRQRSDIVIADFEYERYGDWKTEGDAFGAGPAKGTLPGQWGTVEGYLGERLVNSFKADSKGKLTSPVFTIERKYINFLAGGIRSAGKECVNLLIDNQVVLTEPDPADVTRPSGLLEWITWDVSAWQGKEAVIEIVDQQTKWWDYITIDQIYQSDENRAGVSFAYDSRRKITFDKQYLNIPIKQGAKLQRLSIFIDEKMVRDFGVELAESEPDYWMFLDVNEWKGKEGVIQVAKMAKESEGLNSIFVDTTVKGFDSLYNEKNRPQFHFTSRRGWHNDPNGLVYYKGEYHLFYQHNPLGWAGSNISWGHAISTDLVHWKEVAPALYPDQMGTEFSGSGVVDWNNTAGLQQGDENTLVLFYTAAGGTSVWSKDQPFTQCIAYSTNKGRTWTKFSGNPVLPNIIGDNRDPKVVWYEPGKKWIMALFLDGNRFGLFTSADLKSWTQIQEITIEEGAECPDFFQIPLDGDKKKMKWVLTAANGRFLVGSFDGKQFKPETESCPSDFSAAYSLWGKNYYAVQTFSDIQDGRTIQLGWMAGSEFKGMPFNQQFAFPRELILRTTREGIRLCAVPAREIETLHGKQQAWRNLTVNPGDNPMSSLKGELYHIVSEFVVDKNTAEEFGFNLRGFEVFYNTKTNMIRARRPTDNVVSEVKLMPEKGKIRMEILLDRASVEIFANNGEVPMSFFYLPDDGNRSLSVVCKEGNVLLNSMDVYELGSIWETN